MAPSDLLRPLEGQRQETFRLLEGLGERELDRETDHGGWKVRDVIAHLSGAELGQAFLIRMAAQGDVVHLTAEDRDRINQEEVGKATDWDMQRLRDELEESRHALREAFAGMDEDDLDRPIKWPEWPARTIRTSIPYMLEHEDSHLDEIRRATGREG